MKVLHFFTLFTAIYEKFSNALWSLFYTNMKYVAQLEVIAPLVFEIMREKTEIENIILLEIRLVRISLYSLRKGCDGC